MKISVQLGLLPGSTPVDKANWAKDHGVEGIELTIWDGALTGNKRYADAINGILPITSVCGNCDADGTRSFDFLHPDLHERRKSIEGSKAILEFCGQVGATGQVVPPIFGEAVVPDLAPLMSRLELEDKLMVAALQELGPWAAQHKTIFLLEPLNRYEQHYLRKQSDGLRVIKQAGVEGVGLLSDIFHMHIEETDTPAALIEAGKYVNHVHLADNTREEPGTGDIDLVAAFKALKQIGFTGYMAYECGISGGDKAASLAKSLDYVRSCIAKS